MRIVVAFLAALLALTACSSDAAPPARSADQLRASLVSAADLGVTVTPQVDKASTSASTVSISERFDLPGSRLIFVTLIAGATGTSAAQAFRAYAANAERLLRGTVTRDGLSLGDAGFALEGRTLGTDAAQRQLVFVRGAIEAQVTILATHGDRAALSAADRALVLKAATAQDARLR